MRRGGWDTMPSSISCVGGRGPREVPSYSVARVYVLRSTVRDTGRGRTNAGWLTQVRSSRRDGFSRIDDGVESCSYPGIE